jgi:hypothetical protein
VGILAMLAVVASTLAAWPATADWSVGNNLGLTIMLPSGGGDSAVLFDAPAGAGSGFLMLGTMPGMRFGFTNDARQEEFHLDGGLGLISGGGDSFTSLQITGNFQHAFRPMSQGNQPFITLGAGANLLSGGSSTVTSLVMGIGIGQRVWVADQHGSVRFELRYDRVGEAKESGYVVQEALNTFQVRIGYDLWPGPGTD